MEDDKEALLPSAVHLDPFSDDAAVELDSIYDKEPGLLFDSAPSTPVSVDDPQHVDTAVYAIEDTEDIAATIPTLPQTAYVNREDVRRLPKNSIVTVGPNWAPASKLRRRLSDASINSDSSGITILEVAPPEPMLHLLQAQAPGTYKVTIKDAKTQGTEPKAAVRYTLLPMEYNDRMATTKYLKFLTNTYPLPAMRGAKWYNELRFGFFSVYRRLFALVMFANLVALFAMIARASYSAGSLQLGRFTYGQATTAVGANLFVSTMMRNDHCVNLLFRTALALPHWVPLVFRKHAAKVYSYGGLHSACGVAALLWYIFFTVLVVTQFRGTGSENDALAITTALMLLLFVVLVVMAHPWIRSHCHDLWELSHRYAGWTSIGIVWAQVFIIASAETRAAYPDSYKSHLGGVLARTPVFWFLFAITLLIIYPWLHLRRRTFEAEQLSSHAIRLKFNYRKVPIGAAIRLSDSPLTQNHAFAVIPNPDGSKGYSVIISNAGDWTRKFINDPNRPKHLWMKGLPTLGVVHISLLFKPVVVVATGSGIGPCLSFLQMHPNWPVRIVWSARFPEVTYGSKVIASVLRSDEDAIIIDTKKTGTPDLAGVVYASYKEIGAEAVVIISNQRVTEKVVYALETRGVPAFGAIFDS